MFEFALGVARDAAGLAPASYELVMDAALAARHVIDIHGNRNAGAALILQLSGEVHHLILVAEFGGGGELPPELRAFARIDDLVDAAGGNQHGVRSRGALSYLLIATREGAVL